MDIFNNDVVKEFITSATTAFKSFGENQNRESATHGWKIQQVGYLNPNLDLSFGGGDHTQVGSDTHWRNVLLFADSVREHALDPARSKVLARDFPQLLRGNAQGWWAAELSTDTKTLMLGNLEKLLEKTIERFKVTESEALRFLENDKFKLDHVHAGVSIRDWAAEHVRYCRAANLSLTSQQMSHLYNSLYAQLRVLVLRPDKGMRLDDYLTHLEEKAQAHRDAVLVEPKAVFPRPNLEELEYASINQRLLNKRVDIVNRPMLPAPVAYMQESAEEHGSYDQDYDGDNSFQADRQGQGNRPGYQFPRGNQDPNADQQFRRYSPSYRGQYRGRFNGRGNFRGNFRANYRGNFRGRYNGPYRGRFDGRRFDRGPRRFNRWIRTGRGDQSAYFQDEQYVPVDEQDKTGIEEQLTADGYFFLEEVVRDEEDAYYYEESVENQDKSAYFIVPTGANVPRPASLERRTCWKCKLVFPSRNTCMNHVYQNSCQSTSPSIPPTVKVDLRKPPGVKKVRFAPLPVSVENVPEDTEQQPSSSTEAVRVPLLSSAENTQEDVLPPDPVEEEDDQMDDDAFLTNDVRQIFARPRPMSNLNLPKKHTYMTFPIVCGNIVTTVCADTGASHIIADRNWVEQNFPGRQRIFGDTTTFGGLGGPVTLKEKGIFDITIPARRGDEEVQLIVPVTAWVKDHLGPNLLLGNNWLDENGAMIDFPKRQIKLSSCEQATISMEVVRKGGPAKRKVVAKCNTVIPPHSTTTIPARYADLQEFDEFGQERMYSFLASRNGALNAIVKANTPKLVPYMNFTDSPVMISRNTRLGIIQDTDEDGFFATDWTRATAAQASQECKEEVLQAFMTYDMDVTEELIHALTAEAATMEDIWLAIHPDIKGRESSPFDKKQHRDDIPVGPAKPPGEPEVCTKDGVNIAATNPNFAARLKEILEKHDVWRDKGIIPMPEEQKMRVDLVEGWQRQRIRTKHYRLGIEDQALLDETFDNMHASGRLDWMKEPSPFGCPVFVVWRMVEGKRKGRVVVDLRALNDLVIPDVYPMPSQDDILSYIRGKKFITVFDATAFFYQLPLWGPHKNRMVVMSPRGLEVSNVCLMGFKNSPAFAQRFMDQTLFSYKDFCRAYIDDVVIFSDTEEEHLSDVDTILKHFEDIGLSLSAKKSFCGYTSIRLLGLKVDGFGIAITQDRTQAIQKLKFPHTLADLETYLGMATWLRKYVPWFQQKAEPLQKRKTEMLATGRTDGDLPKANITLRKKWTSTRKLDPTPEELESFRLLQDALSDGGYLVHWNPRRQTFLKIDASRRRGFAVMVFHLSTPWKEGPISLDDVEVVMYLSKVLTSAERKYEATELEVACLVWVCRQLRPQLHSCVQDIVVLTDHKATRGVINQKNLHSVDVVKSNPRLTTASTYLKQYKLDVRHIPGKVNLVPDALSRLPTSDTEKDMADREDNVKSELDDITEGFGYVMSESFLDPKYKQKIIDGYKTDRRITRIMNRLLSEHDGHRHKILQRIEKAKGKKKENLQTQLKEYDKCEAFRIKGFHFHVKEELLYNVSQSRDRLVIPDSCHKEIFDMVHDAKHHFGPERMLHDLDSIAIPSLTRKVKDYVEHCPDCRQNRTNRQKEPGSLHPIQAEPFPYHTVTLDFIVGLPQVSSKNTFWSMPGHDTFDALLTITCKFTKKVILIPGHTTYTAEEWATITWRVLILLDWGAPKRMISDRDPKFMSEFWRTLFFLQGTKLSMTTAYHPQGDGQSERTNQEVEIAIRYHTTASDEPWIHIIPSLQHNMNNAKSSVTGRTPNEMTLGFRPSSVLSVLEVPHNSLTYETFRKLYQREAELAMDFAAADSKIRYDARHTPLEFNIGDEVYLRLHKGYNLPGKPPRKWSQQRVGPLTVIRRVGDLSYELNFPRHWRVHRTVSVAHLCKAPKGSDPYNRRRPQPGRIFVEGDDNEWQSYEIEKLLGRRINNQGNRPTIEYLVKWKDYGSQYNEWYPRIILMQNATELINDYDRKNKLTQTELLARGHQEIQTPPQNGMKDTSDDFKFVDVIPRTNIQVHIPSIDSKQ